MYYTSSLLFMLSLGSSKINVVLFLDGLTANPRQRRIFRWLGVIIATWMVSSLLALALQCDLSHPWLLVGQECHGSVCMTGLLHASIGEDQC
jgi:hypothetical protein